MKEAWAQGYTGHGIVVSILDDGIEKNHPDLAGNYVRRWGREALTPPEECQGALMFCCMIRLFLTMTTSFPGSWGQL